MSEIRDEFKIFCSYGPTIAEEFSKLLNALDEEVPAGRAKALVVTNLQQAFTWALLGKCTPQ